MLQTVKVDKQGKLTLPQDALDALGVKKEAELVMELTDNGVLLSFKKALPPLTEQIAVMNLPIGSWEQMETETEAGRTS